MSERTLGVGIVGYGFMGKTHSYAYQSLPMLYEPPPARVKLVGVAVRTPATQKLAIEQAGFQFATADYRDLLERDDIHIINCCTPNDAHRDLVVDAIRAGKHVYVDKPLAADVNEAEQIVAAADEADAAGLFRTRQMTFNYRFIPALMRARQLVEEGRIGKVHTFNIRFLHSSNVDPERPLHWKSDPERGGGVFVDLGSHLVDLAHWLVGDITRVLSHPFTQIKTRPDGRGGTVEVRGDDACYVIAETTNGAVGIIEASKIATGANDGMTVDIRGEKGALTFDLMEPEWLRFYDNTLPEQPLGGMRGFTAIECVQRYGPPASLPGPKVTPGWIRFHIHSIYDFVRRVAEGLPGEPSLRDGLAVQRVLHACYQDPGTWTPVGGDDAAPACKE